MRCVTLSLAHIFVAQHVCSRQPKKVCAVAFCPDSKHVLFANKFGDVNVAPIDESGADS